MKALFSDSKVYVSGKIAFIPSDPWILADTIRSNIIFGSKFDQIQY